MKGLKLYVFVIILMMASFISTRVGWAHEEKEEVIKLQEIVVSAPSPEKKLVEVPQSISIITSDEIEEMGAKNIVEVVENIAGVIKESSTRNEVTFRGNRSSQSAGVLVLVDGVAVNSGIGNYVQYDAIPVSSIERIEVLRSSGTIVFGPDAARGVINIITKKGAKGTPQMELGASFGSWNTCDTFAGIAGQVNDFDYGLRVSLLDTDGYKDNDKQRSSASFSLGYNFSDNTRMGLNLSQRETDYITIYGKSKWQVENYRRNSIYPKSETDPNTLIHPREENDVNTVTSLDFRHEGKDFFINGLVSYDETDHIYERLEKKLDPTASKTSSYYDYREDRDQNRFFARSSGGYHFNLNQTKYVPTFGIDYEKTGFDQIRTYPWSPQPLSKSQNSAIAKATIDAERKRWGLFWDNELDFGKQWEINLGGRVDDVEYDVESQEPKKVEHNTTDYSWNITPAFHPNPDSTLYASASGSYWYPVLQYYKYAMEYGDTQNRPKDLKDEEYITYELGYKQYYGSKLSLAFTGYYMKIKDKFLSLYDQKDWKGYSNVGESEHKGLEIEAAGRISPYFGYRFSGAYQHAEWDEANFRTYVWGLTPADDTRENVDISGKKIPQVPEFTSTLGLDFYFMKYCKLSADVNHYGKRYVDVLNRYQMDDYDTVDAMISYKRENVKLWILANNIFDTEKESMFNETGKRNSDGTPSHLYYPLEGRYVEAGITLTF